MKIRRPQNQNQIQSVLSTPSSRDGESKYSTLWELGLALDVRQLPEKDERGFDGVFVAGDARGIHI